MTRVARQEGDADPVAVAAVLAWLRDPLVRARLDRDARSARMRAVWQARRARAASEGGSA